MDGSIASTVATATNPPSKQLFTVDKKAFADSVLSQNSKLDWVKRLYEQNAPSIQVPGEKYRSTHLMADDGKGYVYPTVVRQSDGSLKKLTEDEAYDYAKKTGTGIQLPPKQGSWFAANGYKLGTGVFNAISDQGTPFNNPNFQIDKNGIPIESDATQPPTPYNQPPITPKVMQQDNTKYIPPTINQLLNR